VLAAFVPELCGGDADLSSSTKTNIAGEDNQDAEHPGGRNVRFGVREHAMGAIGNGMLYHGGVRPFVSTFFVFADYMRPAVRLAALCKLPLIVVWTHDSVAVGEDGPTHQPVEQLATIRAIPGLQVIRPAAANETVAAWKATVEHDGPTALVLSRQAITVVTDGSAVERGAGIVHEPDGPPTLVLLATGSEVSLCVDAAARLADHDVAARVVSLPSWDRFERQDEAFRRSVLPTGVPVLSVEAATTFGWARYADESIGIDRFGASAPGAEVLDKLGINVEHVVGRAIGLIS
jgi:transketolase